MICVTCRHFEYLMRYEKSATSGVSMWKVMTSSDSYRQGLSNDMRHVPPFLIFNQIRKIGDIRRFDLESDDVIGLISARAFEWYMSRAASLDIWSDTKNRRHPEVRFGKWWCHRTQLGKGFRMICVTCRNFKYLMRYGKSATSGGGTGKMMTSSDSSRRGLSNDMRYVPPFWIFNEIRIIGDIRRFDAGSIDVIGLSSARVFEWYASRSVILNI